jgi:hypothetical protein
MVGLWEGQEGMVPDWGPLPLAILSRSPHLDDQPKWGPKSKGVDPPSTKAMQAAVTASVQKALGPLKERLQASVVDAIRSALAEQVQATNNSPGDTYEAVQKLSCDLATLHGMILGLNAASGHSHGESFRRRDSSLDQGHYGTPQSGSQHSETHGQSCRCNECSFRRSPY